MVYIVSQDGERIINMFQYSLRYEGQTNGRDGKITHAVCIDCGFTEAIAAYETKEDCLQIMGAYAQTVSMADGGSNFVFKMPTKEAAQETIKQYEALKELYNHAAGQVGEGLKELYETLAGGI